MIVNSDTVFKGLPRMFRGQHINSYSQVVHNAGFSQKTRVFGVFFKTLYLPSLKLAASQPDLQTNQWEKSQQ
jgi:hypothetical protein